LIDGLGKISGVTVYAARNRAQQAPVVSFNIKEYTPGDVGTILDQAFDTKVRTGLHCSPAMHKTLGHSHREQCVSVCRILTSLKISK